MNPGAGSSQIPHSRSAGPSPTKPVRRAASAYGAFDYQLDEAEMNLQMSKSGRMRKVRPPRRAVRAAALRRVKGAMCCTHFVSRAT